MKPLCVIQAPFATRSGHGDMARDIVRHIINLDRYDVKLISTPWGGCPMNALESPRDDAIIAKTMAPPFGLPRQPELFIQITVPNEFQPMGKYNIGITAGIETTMCSAEWMEGCNRMDVIFTISQHSKDVLVNSAARQMTPNGQVVAELKINKPVEVLHNCVHTDIFKRVDVKEIPESVRTTLKDVKEDFCYLFVGHWLQGNYGEDRKNVSTLVKVFGETFKHFPANKRPALVLKTSGAGFSVLDREDVLRKIRQIKETVGSNCPNIYLSHGELSEEEMNGLYNHPKIKAHVSFTKGEGFGRPSLESTMSYKPVIASGWSGHLDFLNVTDSVLLNGEIGKVEPGAVWPGVIVAESGWFNVNHTDAAVKMVDVFRNYDKYRDGCYRLANKNRQAFSFDAIQTQTAELLDKYVPKFATAATLKLPSLKKL